MKASERDATAEECREVGKTKGAHLSLLSQMIPSPPPLQSTACSPRPSGPPVECPFVSEERVRPAERVAVLAQVALQRRFHVRSCGVTVPLELVFSRIPPLTIMTVPVRAQVRSLPLVHLGRPHSCLSASPPSTRRPYSLETLSVRSIISASRQS